jgi:uncharacterized protein YuzE
MKLNYYSDTDSLYIDLSEQPSVESREISEGIVLDYDTAGSLVGIDIDNASRKVELKELILNKLPAVVQNNSASRACTEVATLAAISFPCFRNSGKVEVWPDRIRER